MKIVHCFFSFNVGGAESMLVDIMNEQAKDNDITLLILNKSYSDYLLSTINKKVKIKILNRENGSKSILPIVKLNYYIWKLNPEVVHLHSFSLVRAIKIPKSKLYFTAHCLDIPNTYFHKFNKIFAISKAVENDIHNKGNDNVKLISNGIDIAKVKAKSNYNPKEIFKIVQVGSLICPIKGQDILIRSLSVIIHQYGIFNITIDFIGAGDSLAELEQLAKKLNVEKNIYFLGLRDRDYIYSHLCEYDLMCHPSRNEGFGLTVVEGMVAKLPVLVATGDGPFEIIGKGEYGYYFQRENIEDCAAKIVDIYRNYHERSCMVKNAYLHIAENYSVQKTAQKYLEEYK
ncbi:MAG: glycosyltransferase [Bacteroidales bacterium]